MQEARYFQTCWCGVQGTRKIDFAAFECTLPLLAGERGVPAEEVRRAIVLSGGPRRNSSVTPDFVRLHDDKSTFTGVRFRNASDQSSHEDFGESIYTGNT